MLNIEYMGVKIFMNNKKVLLKGMKDGIPIGLGYFAVCFSLGIIAKKAGITPWEGFFSSLFTRASAGEYGGLSVILAKGTLIEMVIISLVTNLRYLLMNTALSQRFSPDTSLFKRIIVGTCVTDEIFGISIAYEGYLNPLYPIGATLVAGPMWALGDLCGIVAGSILPANVVSALSVALYGMFLAIIIPPAKKDKVVLCAIIISFLLSYIATLLPFISALSSGSRTIILTILISTVTAILKPIKDDKE